ncbi:MAG: hypothetical protein A3A86_02220 [Elusimicrobia bacterium RIFCSPLOWO2_01_FULL_60_11]|nr:MAG: hypothetical protein A3A86_02220 [Elusimicrobia bacterium RIFCSPLOWO2_01_FULL_60_11]
MSELRQRPGQIPSERFVKANSWIRASLRPGRLHSPLQHLRIGRVLQALQDTPCRFLREKSLILFSGQQPALHGPHPGVEICVLVHDLTKG